MKPRRHAPRFALPLLLGLTVLPPGCAEDRSGDYLKDGRLVARLEVRVVQGGVAGFTGTYYAIEADGTWESGPVPMGPDEMRKPDASGRLDAGQLARLARALADNDLATLPGHGKPVVNPRVVTVVFGKRSSELQPGPEPPPDADRAIRKRYERILQAAKNACGRK